jgi:hypothetical protein
MWRPIVIGSTTPKRPECSSRIQAGGTEITHTPFVPSLLVRNLALMWRRFSFALLVTVGFAPAAIADVVAVPELTELAQAQPPAPAAKPAVPTPATATPAAKTAATSTSNAQQAAEEPIGNVATVTGTASVVRNNATTPLQLKDDIYLNDVVQTSASSSLGITFNDATTFNLKANAQITIDSYVYEDGGKNNAAIFDVVKGTVAFAAAAVAKTGNMAITTPTASLGIRGTTGLVEIPSGAGASSPNIKLYPDADGKVGRIEVNDRAGVRLGALTQGASGFTIRPGAAGARLAAVPLTISPQQAQRDQGFVRQVHATQDTGRRVVDEQRAFRRANPNAPRPNAPRRSGSQPPNGAPGQNRTGPQQPGQPKPGQPQQPGSPAKPGQLQQPGTPNRPGAPARQGQQQPTPGSPQQAAQPPRSGQPQQAGAPTQPGGSQPTRAQTPGLQPAQPGVQQAAPATQGPGLANRPFQPRRAAPAPRFGKSGKKRRF